ncbi:hypothetical protein ACSX1A_03455 [Pontibacter sp. MBLB2868]|uniref:hypothetical protein n=1 Tax=Pontibacter sp. MBLB2868 TaxID=3451555 RepID=UPI003F7508A1
MHQLRYVSFLLVLFTIALVGCDKDEDKEPTKTDLLTSVTWKGNRVFVDGQDATSFVDVDNTSIKFDKNGEYTFVFDGDQIQGNWEFSSDEQKIILDKGSQDETTVDLLLLTASNLNLKFNLEDTSGTFTVEVRFIK